VNSFLKQAQKTNRFKEMAVERLAQVYALLMVEEEETQRLHGEVSAREEHVEHLSRKNSYLQDKLGSEEDAKRRTLLRYVNAVKASAVNEGKDSPGTGAIQLPESGITDEEVHAIAALLRGNTSIVDLNLRGNLITDEGARALSAVLGGRSGLQSLDLRGNRIGKLGIRAMAEALERSDRVRHVYVHAGGKIEALGTNRWADPRLNGEGGENPGGNSSELAAAMVTVETVCVVDCRENNPSAAGGVGDGEGEPTAVASAAMLPAAQQTMAVSSEGQFKLPKSKKSKGSSSKEEQIRKEEAARAKAMSRRRAEEERRAATMEMGWDGRAGGMELRLPPAPGSSNSDSGESRPMGARSAPLLGLTNSPNDQTIGASKSNRR
jgi:myosin protein heavy chain